MKIKRMILENFKGIAEKEMEFGENGAIISGKNGAGKSTILDAHFWLWSDRNYDLKSNPNIRPDDGRECVPTVTEVLDFGGTEITVSKSQKCKKSKPDESGVCKVSLTNAYSVNDVPKAFRDFTKYFADYGVDFDNFLFFSHPEALISDGKKLRPMIMSLAQSKTDIEVAMLTGGCGEVEALLKSYKMDEISAMWNATKKKAKAELDAIPQRIIGLESAKIDIDVAELELQRNALHDQITATTKKLEDGNTRGEDYRTLEDEIFQMEFDRNEAERAANADIVKAKVAAENELVELEKQEREAKNNLSLAEMSLKHAEMGIRSANADLLKAQEEYPKYKAMAFDTGEMDSIQAEEIAQESFICPSCGQMLTPEQQEEVKANFQKGKEKRLAEQQNLKIKFEERRKKNLEETVELGNVASERLNTANAAKAEAELAIENAKKTIVEISAKVAEKKKEIEAMPDGADLSQNGKYQAIVKEIADKRQKLKEMSNQSEYQAGIKAELKAKRTELSAVESEIAKAENNVRIDEKISELEEQKRNYAQKMADAERILNEVDLVSRAKNELLQDEINGKFDGVKFQLFDYLKNGEYKETCIQLVFNGIDWKKVGETANTSLAFRAKLKILEGLQNAFGADIPVLADGAECNDTKSLVGIECGRQLIMMKVTDEPELTITMME